MGNRKAIFVVIGGLADEAIDGLGRKTPLQVAKTPNLDHLAMLGACGVYHQTVIGEVLTPWLAMFLLLGNHRELFPGLAVLEAIAHNLKVSKRKFYAVLEPCIVEEGVLKEKKPFVDHEEEKDFFTFLKSEIKNVEPLSNGRFLYYLNEPINGFHPWVVGSKVDFDALSDFYKIPERWEGNAKRIEKGLLPINSLFVYGGGKPTDYISTKNFDHFKFYTDSSFFKGIVSWMGKEAVYYEGFHLKEALQLFFKAVLEDENEGGVFFFYSDYLHRNDLQYKAWRRVEMIEEIDEIFSIVVDSIIKENVLFVFTSDVTTPSDGMMPFSGLPVPVLMVGCGVRRGRTVRFDEANAVNGSLGILRGSELLLAVESFLGLNRPCGF